MRQADRTSPPVGGLGFRARETIFDLRRSVGSVDSTGFAEAAAGCAEVVVNPAAARRFGARVGAEGAWAMLTMVGMAEEADGGRMVVRGGSELLRQELGWGRDKIQRVLRTLCDAGYVLREQINIPGPGGSRRFGTTELVLFPSEERHSGSSTPAGGAHRGADADPGAGKGADAGPGTGVCGAGFSGHAPAGTGTAGHHARQSPGQPAAGFSGHAPAGSAHDHDHGDEQPHSSFMVGHDASSTSGADSGGVQPDPSVLARLAVELEGLGFVDAGAVIEHHGPSLVAEAVAYVRAKPGIANPGAYLRNMLRNGRVPSTAGAAVAPGRGSPTADGARDPARPSEPADLEVVALHELVDILGALPDAEREAITEAVDAGVAADPWATRSAWLADGCRHRLLQQALSDAGHLRLSVGTQAAPAAWAGEGCGVR